MMKRHGRWIRRNGVRQGLILIILILAVGASAPAADFGLVLNTAGEYGADAAGEGFGFTGSLRPWVSAALGGKAGLYLSGKATFQYEHENDAWAAPVLAELERTELNFRPVPALYVILGRQQYRDSGGMILSGLFDGIYGSLGLSRARISLGAFYTGLLYQGTAEIAMTAEDRDRRLRPLDYADLDTYFASRRVLVPLDLEFPDLASRLSLALTLLAQFDVNAGPALHSQYLETRFGIDAADSLRFTLTGIGVLEENEGADMGANFAAALAADWDMPGALTDMLSAELRWGSGAVNGRIGPFKPVSGIAQGTIFTPALPGLMNARAAYTARPLRTLSLATEAVFFWRTDTETFTDAELDSASEDRFLGTEVRGSLVWAVQSALRLSAGGGAFFPSGAFVEGAGIRWKINAGIILSL
jgi:hypothetical protein